LVGSGGAQINGSILAGQLVTIVKNRDRLREAYAERERAMTALQETPA
jgi:hypothetical protein